MRVKIPQAAIDDYLSGLSIGQVADKYGASPNGVWNKLKANGVVCRGSRNFTDAEELQIAHIYRAGHSVKSIMRAYGFKHHISFVDALKRQGVKQRSPAARNRLYQINHNAFDVIDNEHKAYWWGFLYADATVYKRSLRVGLAIKDRSQNENLKTFLKSQHPIKVLDEKLNGKIYKKTVFFCTSKHLTDKLRELGVMKDRPHFERVINNLPSNLVNHWLRGYFDGDGSAKLFPCIGFVGQQEMLLWIRHQMAINAGTNPKLKVGKVQGKNIYRLQFSGKDPAIRAAEFLYKDATIWMERKRKRINDW